MKKALLFPILLGFAMLSHSQNFDTFLRDSLDVYVKREMGRWQIPGLSIAVVKDNKVLVCKGYGTTQQSGSESVTKDTRFMIGSNTKAMTGTEMALLAYQGKCQMNDRLQQHLPQFAMRDPWVASHVTLTDILCHRLGMETFQGDFTWWGSSLSDAQSYAKFARLKPVYEYRTTWGYTNMGFTLAGDVIAKLSGRSWHDNTAAVLFEPLGMKNSLTRIDTASTLPAALARPHTVVEGKLISIPIEPIDNLAPAASVWSTAEDMSHWAMMLLDSGRWKGREVLPWDVIAMTRTPVSIQGRVDDPRRGSHYDLYGLGWDLTDVYGREMVSHTGGVNGFVSSVTLFPEEDLGIVILTNTDANNLFQNLKWQLVDLYFGQEYENVSARSFGRFTEYETWRWSYINAQRDSVAKGVTSDLTLKAFAGTYSNEVYGTVTLQVKGNGLEMSFANHPHMTAALGRLTRDRFLTTYSDPTFGIVVTQFRTRGKKVTGLELRCADFVEFTPYEFVKK